jgi:uncharacterized radical SAM superfamily Fe-S cluster-containing enzyme
MKFEPISHYSAKREREAKAFTIDLTDIVKLNEDDAGHKFISGSSLPFSTARVVSIYGSFKFNDVLYVFRREYSKGVFAYTNVAATSVIFIKD